MSEWILLILMALALWACGRSDSKVVRRRKEEKKEEKDEPPTFV